MNRITLGTFQSTPAIKEAVNAVLDSGRLSYGQLSAEYERKFAELHHSEYGVVSNSGTSSLLVALQALKEIHGWRDWSGVIVPSTTFVATVNVVLHCQLRPVFVDVDPLTYCIDVEQAAAAINSQVVAIIPVHMFGHPARMDYIMDLAEKHGLAVIEDCCEAMCAEYNDRKVGSYGDVGCFSTYAAHHLVTGVGGMAVTSNMALQRHMRSLVNHGIALDELPTGERYDPTFLARKFTFDKRGHSFRMTELEAAIGLAEIGEIEARVEQRRANAFYLSGELLSMNLPLSAPIENIHSYHSWMVFPILLDPHSNRDRVMAALNEAGVETRTMMPLINQPCYRSLSIRQADYPVSSYINDMGFYVGCHHGLGREDMEYLAQVIGSSVLEQVQWTR